MHVVRRWTWIALCCGAALAACDVDPPATTAEPAPGEVTAPEPPVSITTRDAASNEVQGNCGGELSPEPVDLAWSDLAAFAESRLDRGASLFVRAHNTGSKPVTVRLVAEVSQRGVTRTVDLERVRLAPGESRRVALPPATLGIQHVRSGLAGHVSIRGAVDDAKGTTIMTVFAPGRSFHVEREGDALTFYDDEIRDRKYGKGDPFGVIPQALRDDPTVLSITDHDEAAQNAAGAIQ